MERITTRDADHKNWIAVTSETEAYRKLADYEDTGLTPEEIFEMQAKWCALKQWQAEMALERKELEE